MNKYSEGTATIHANIRKIFKNRKRGIQAWKVANLYAAKFGKIYSDSSITARFREMNDIRCNLRDYTYTMEKGKC